MVALDALARSTSSLGLRCGFPSWINRPDRIGPCLISFVVRFPFFPPHFLIQRYLPKTKTKINVLSSICQCATAPVMGPRVANLNSNIGCVIFIDAVVRPSCVIGASVWASVLDKSARPNWAVSNGISLN